MRMNGGGFVSLSREGVGHLYGGACLVLGSSIHKISNFIATFMLTISNFIAPILFLVYPVYQFRIQGNEPTNSRYSFESSASNPTTS